MDNGDVLHVCLPQIRHVFLHDDVGVVDQPDVQPIIIFVDIVQPVLLPRGAVKRIKINRVILPELVEILVLFPVYRTNRIGEVRLINVTSKR